MYRAPDSARQTRLDLDGAWTRRPRRSTPAGRAVADLVLLEGTCEPASRAGYAPGFDHGWDVGETPAHRLSEGRGSHKAGAARVSRRARDWRRFSKGECRQERRRASRAARRSRMSIAVLSSRSSPSILVSTRRISAISSDRSEPISDRSEPISEVISDRSASILIVRRASTPSIFWSRPAIFWSRRRMSPRSAWISGAMMSWPRPSQRLGRDRTRATRCHA